MSIRQQSVVQVCIPGTWSIDLELWEFASQAEDQHQRNLGKNNIWRSDSTRKLGKMFLVTIQERMSTLKSKHKMLTLKSYFWKCHSLLKPQPGALRKEPRPVTGLYRSTDIRFHPTISIHCGTENCKHWVVNVLVLSVNLLGYGSQAVRKSCGRLEAGIWLRG